MNREGLVNLPGVLFKLEEYPPPQPGVSLEAHEKPATLIENLLFSQRESKFLSLDFHALSLVLQYLSLGSQEIRLDILILRLNIEKVSLEFIKTSLGIRKLRPGNENAKLEKSNRL